MRSDVKTETRLMPGIGATICYIWILPWESNREFVSNVKALRSTNTRQRWSLIPFLSMSVLEMSLEMTASQDPGARIQMAWPIYQHHQTLNFNKLSAFVTTGRGGNVPDSSVIMNAASSLSYWQSASWSLWLACSHISLQEVQGLSSPLF